MTEPQNKAANTEETSWFASTQDFVRHYRNFCLSTYSKPFEKCTDTQRYTALARMVASQSRKTSHAIDKANKPQKKVYYFSLEFLIGPLLNNYLMNLGIHDVVADGLQTMGTSLETLCAKECDPGLGNGGLGRLAACFLDSMAHEGVAGYGNGMRYRYGFFRQGVEDGCQVEHADNWLNRPWPWEARQADSAVTVRFGGHVVRHEDENGRFWFTQEGGEKILAVPYDVPVVGYGAKTINKLRLWSAEPYEENFDLDAFNAGDYAAANKYRTDIEAISTILYPNDSGEHGRLLRLKQEYLFTCAGLQTILRTYEKEWGPDWGRLGDHVCVHTNDTHPALAGPELMRQLVDEKGVDFDLAYEIVKKTVSYTNHTVMPEALEKWSIDLIRSLIPRTYMFIEEIDRRYREDFPRDHEGWFEQLSRTAILWDGQVRMANCSVIFSHSVNGVSALHTSILEKATLKDFYDLTPEKFNNKTNGVAHRRFLAESNPHYAKLITSAIGDGWMHDADELQKLVPFETDAAFQEGFAHSRKWCKERLARYIQNTTGIVLDPNSVFDVQVKRFHAYKRQLLSCFKVMDLYNRMLEDPTFKPQPTSFIFSGKAAQSYFFAKEVIRLVNSLADVINNDPRVNDYLKVAFVPNFAVSNAQLIYPAADISEQISWAGSEASGTSNMKLMMNGAITLGTFDGSNVEITDLAGEDNVKIFGLRSHEVDAERAAGRFWAWDAYHNDRQRLGKIIDTLTDGTYGKLSGNFESIHDGLMIGNDHDFVLRDFYSYLDAWEELTNGYQDQATWRKTSIHNTAMSGFFSSDRTIREYARDIWYI